LPKDKNIIVLLMVFFFSLTFVACGEAAPTPEPTAVPTETQVPTPSPLPTEAEPTAESPTATPADTSSASTLFIETVSVNKVNGRTQLAITGNLPDACTEVVDVEQAFILDTNTFDVDDVTERPEDVMCAEVLTPFERTLTLQTADLQPGTYTVNVHGETDTFALTAADQAPDDSTAQIGPVSGPPGTIVQLTTSGLPANVEVELGAGREDSEYDIVDTASTDNNGALTTDVQIPEFAEAGDQWVIVVEAPSGAKTISNEFSVTNSETGTTFDQTNIFLVAPEDAGQSGDEIGCGDSIVPVTIDIEPTIAPLTAALENMFAIDEEFYGQSGLYNTLHQSNLSVQGIDIDNGHATIALEGELQLGGVCDNPRVEAQLEYTARQYSTIDTVSITINGQPLEEMLSG